MKDQLKGKILAHSFIRKNWEADIRKVLVEPCEKSEDPSGYRAVFFIRAGTEKAQKAKSFSIGASHLVKRRDSLLQAGYKAPMTRKAIALLENRLGKRVSLFDTGSAGVPA